MPEKIQLRTKASLYHYTAYVTDVYDGDTITVDIDMGLGLWRHGETIRFWKVNTPELRGEERPRGLEVRDFVRSLVLERTILLRTILDKRARDRTGKFGRLLGEVLVESDDPGADDADEDGFINVNLLLLSRGFALPVGADGSTVTPTGLPAPAAQPQTAPGVVNCPYCGQRRVVEAGVVLACPNCLDGAFAWRELGQTVGSG